MSNTRWRKSQNPSWFVRDAVNCCSRCSYESRIKQNGLHPFENRKNKENFSMAKRGFPSLLRNTCGNSWRLYDRPHYRPHYRHFRRCCHRSHHGIFAVFPRSHHGIPTVFPRSHHGNYQHLDDKPLGRYSFFGKQPHPHCRSKGMA